MVDVIESSAWKDQAENLSPCQLVASEMTLCKFSPNHVPLKAIQGASFVSSFSNRRRGSFLLFIFFKDCYEEG